MVYMAGDNNLSDRCVDDLREMKMAGVSNDVTVRVQVDRSSAFNNRPGRYQITGCARYGSNDLGASVEHDRVPAFNQPFNSGRKEPLIGFVKWAIEDRPDDKYMLVLWGHANPQDATPIPVSHPRTQNRFSRRKRRRSCSDPAARDSNAFFQICPDDFTHDGLTDAELRSALKTITNKTGRPIDILGLDACLMSMVELNYELRQYASYIIASESLIPATSWPYHWILAALDEDPSMSAADLCRIITTKYVAYYPDYDDVSVQLSACDSSRCEDLARSVKGLTDTLTPRLLGEDGDFTLRNAILSAHFRAQPYFQEQYYDLYDFCFMLQESCDKHFPEVSAAAKRVMDVIKDSKQPFVLDSKFSPLELSDNNEAADLQFSYGTSIYFPWASVSERYGNLQFARDAGWQDFLSAYCDFSAKFAREDR